MRTTIFTLLLCLSFVAIEAQNNYPKILTEKERADVIDEILVDRFDNLLPTLMHKRSVKMVVRIVE